MSDTVDFKRYKRRWGMLAIIAVLNAVNALFWLSFAPVAPTSARYYDVSTTWIDMMSIVFMIFYIPAGFVSSYVLDKHGLRRSIIAGALLTAIGGWFRFFGDLSSEPHVKFGIAFLGQCLAAIGQPFLLNAPAKLATNWFPASQRAAANMLASVSNPIGAALALFFSPQIVTVWHLGPYGMRVMVMSFAIVGGILGFLSLLIQDKPPTAPSRAAEQELDGFIEGLKKVIVYKYYVLLVITFGIGLGIFNTLTTILAQVLTAQRYTEDDAGWMGALVIGVGLVGAIISAVITDKWHRYNEMVKIIFTLALGATIFFSCVARPDQAGAVAVSLALFGFSGFGILPAALELSVELTYPVSEGTSAGFMWMSGQVFGIILTFICGAMKNPETKDMTNALWLLTACGVLMAMLSYFQYGEYRRLQHDKKLMKQEKKQKEDA